MQQNNNMRWIPIDCTIPGIAGLIIGIACAALADIVPMFHVNWYASKAMWLAPAIGVFATIWLYEEGLRQLPFDATEGEKQKGVDRHA